MEERKKERLRFYNERIKQIDVLYPNACNFYVVPATQLKEPNGSLEWWKESIESPKRIECIYTGSHVSKENKEYIGSLSDEELKEYNPNTVPVSVIEERRLLDSLIDKIKTTCSPDGFKTSDGLAFSGSYGQIYEWQLARLNRLMEQDKDINSEAYENAGGEKKYEEIVNKRNERETKFAEIRDKNYLEEKAIKDRNTAKLNSLKAKRDILMKKKSIFGRKKRSEEIKRLNEEIDNFGSSFGSL